MVLGKNAAICLSSLDSNAAPVRVYLVHCLLYLQAVSVPSQPAQA